MHYVQETQNDLLTPSPQNPLQTKIRNLQFSPRLLPRRRYIFRWLLEYNYHAHIKDRSYHHLRMKEEVFTCFAHF